MRSTPKTDHARMTSTAAARHKFATSLRVIARELDGADFRVETTPLTPRSLTIRLSVPFREGRAVVMIHADGGSRVGAFLGHWHTDGKAGDPYTGAFRAVAGVDARDWRGDAWHKATTHETEWPRFLARIEAGLKWLRENNGSGVCA